MSKLLIFTAPSGAGKTTIVKHLLENNADLAFSISATTREKRPHEKDGKDYYFISPERFRQLIKQDAFVEWEEVYTDQFYGTLKSEVHRLWNLKKHIIFDIDVKGAVNIKNLYAEEALAVFIKPPSIEVLEERLKKRKTENIESLRKRINHATEELKYEVFFDVVLINSDLDVALEKAEKIVRQFINRS